MAQPVRLDANAVDRLRARVAGPVLLPGDDDFAGELATYNLTVVHRPAVVVGASGPEDVRAAVRFATDHGLAVAVLAAGHGSSVPSDGAVLVTVRRMQALTVDATARTARVEAGVRWAEVIEQAGKFGLAPLNGSSPTVSVIGYTLGGGLGPMGRAYGYAADHVRSLDVVTADGEIRHVTAETEPDLFWALRGAKGNFGVVTAIEFDLFPVARLYGGGLFFPGEQAVEVLYRYAEWTADLPEEMTSSVGLLHLPPLPFVPEPLRDRLVVHVRIAYLGTAAEGERLVAPLRDLGPRIIDTVAEMPYTAIASVHADPVDPLPLYESGALLRELTPETIDTILAFAGPEADSPLVLTEVRHLGGALGRPPAQPNAVGNRDAAYSFFAVAAGGPPQARALVDYQRDFVDHLTPWTTGRRYLNFMFAHDTTPDQVRHAFDPETYRRLGALKKRYDPANTFRINHNIPPVG
ncbi:FAD-binding oxidoreductase [Micromonospora sp. NPDC049523]|uniref:FAD-binding oxidoreductase n=1 Tax=Micromonospora sp. NPDC049523 TaxID=3155921 RepID=UPI0034244AE0